MSEPLTSPEQIASGLDAVMTPSETLKAISRSIEEEAAPLRALIADEDSCCIVRDLRSARLEGLEFALRTIRTAEIWDW